MIAYKFRSSSKIDYAFDIIFNQRLHCSEWNKLNDPMEGTFTYSKDKKDYDSAKKRVSEIISQKRNLKVCSLSDTFDSLLLWAHYANGFDGVALAIELPEDDERIRKVNYRNGYPHFIIDSEIEPTGVANSILTSKFSEWEYEQEIRVLSEEKWYDLEDPVQMVIVGHRLHPALFQAIKIVCQQREIEVCKTGLGDEGIDADPVLTVE